MIINPYAFVSAPWTPASLAVPPKIWLNDSSTATDAGGGLCSFWADISGNGHHFAQATGTNQPLIVSSGLNGRRTIRFDGVDNWMGNSGTGGTDVMRNVGAGWMFCVVKKLALDGSPTDRTIFMAPTGTGINNTRFQATIGNAGASGQNKPRLAARRLDADGSAGTLVATNAVDTGWHSFLFQMDWSNGDGFIAVDGAADVQNLSMTSSGNTSNTTSLTRISIGSAPGGTLTFADIELAEIIIGAGSLPSAGEFTNLFNYADDRWGL